MAASVRPRRLARLLLLETLVQTFLYILESAGFLLWTVLSPVAISRCCVAPSFTFVKRFLSWQPVLVLKNLSVDPNSHTPESFAFQRYVQHIGMTWLTQYIWFRYISLGVSARADFILLDAYVRGVGSISFAKNVKKHCSSFFFSMVSKNNASSSLVQRKHVSKTHTILAKGVLLGYLLLLNLGGAVLAGYALRWISHGSHPVQDYLRAWIPGAFKKVIQNLPVYRATRGEPVLPVLGLSARTGVELLCSFLLGYIHLVLGSATRNVGESIEPHGTMVSDDPQERNPPPVGCAVVERWATGTLLFLGKSFLVKGQRPTIQLGFGVLCAVYHNIPLSHMLHVLGGSLCGTLLALLAFETQKRLQASQSRAGRSHGTVPVAKKPLRHSYSTVVASGIDTVGVPSKNTGKDSSALTRRGARKR